MPTALATDDLFIKIASFRQKALDNKLKIRYNYIVDFEISSQI